jgi:hypothetical protein
MTDDVARHVHVECTCMLLYARHHLCGRRPRTPLFSVAIISCVVDIYLYCS